MKNTLIFTPNDVDLKKSPLRGHNLPETFTLGAFNPGLTRLKDGRLLLLVRVAEGLRNYVWDDQAHCIHWGKGKYSNPGYDMEGLDMSDPRGFGRDVGKPGEAFALTSLSWLLPVILDEAGEKIEDIRYDLAIEPRSADQAYGVEDPRISIVNGNYYMTVCSVSERRLGTSLYRSKDALAWEYLGLIFDHQNKDVLLFEGDFDNDYLALTRPQGAGNLLPLPDDQRAPGPSIHLATSPDLLHWRPTGAPILTPMRQGAKRLGGGSQPVRWGQDWLMLYHAVHPGGDVGRYQTYWAVLDGKQPDKVLTMSDEPLLSAEPQLTEPLREQMYLSDVVFTTGMVDAGEYFLVASGEADLACRMTRIPKSTFPTPRT